MRRIVCMLAQDSTLILGGGASQASLPAYHTIALAPTTVLAVAVETASVPEVILPRPIAGSGTVVALGNMDRMTLALWNMHEAMPCTMEMLYVSGIRSYLAALPDGVEERARYNKAGRIPAAKNASSIFKKLALRIAIKWIIDPEWYEVRKSSGCVTIVSTFK